MAKKIEEVSNVVVYDVKVKSIRVYQADDTVRYRVQLDKTIAGIQRDVVTNQYVETEIDYVDFVPRVLIAQCLEKIPGLDVVYTKKKEEGLRNGNASGFGAAELQAVLRDATIKLQRTKFVVGEEYVTSNAEVKTHDHDGYNTAIDSVVLSSRMQNVLDKVVDNMFNL